MKVIAPKRAAAAYKCSGCIISKKSSLLDTIAGLIFQLFTYPDNQLIQSAWLCNIVVCAQLESLAHYTFLPHCRKYDNRNFPGSDSLYRSNYLQARCIWEHQVSQHDIRVFGCDAFYSRFSVIAAFYFETLFL